jgi:hypothetical protein
MPADLNNFQKDLIDPRSGDRSELYRAVKPLTEAPASSVPRSQYDEQRLAKLREDIRKGAVGLEYLTGLKNNEVETFYDAHPVQALTSNVLGNSDKLGLTAALGIPAGNLYNQWKNLKETEHAYHARRSDPQQHAEKRLYPTPGKDGKPSKIDDDIARVFGTGQYEVGGDNDALLRRMEVLDAANGANATHSYKRQIKAYLEDINKINKTLMAMEGKGASKAEMQSFYASSGGDAAHGKLKQELEKIRATSANRNLRSYVDLHKDLSAMKEKGYTLKGDMLGGLGDLAHGSDAVDKFKTRLNAASPRLGGLLDSAIPSSNQGLEDLIRKRILDMNPDSYNEDLIKKILTDTHNIDFAGGSPEAKLMERNMFSSLSNRTTGNTLNRLIRRVAPSAAVGAGVAGAGLGLNALLKMLQSKVYGDDKIKDWKRNSLKARGEFERAEAIQ